jgi:hypothetical protein
VTQAAGGVWTIQMLLPSGSAMEDIRGAPPISIGGLEILTPSMADSRSCSARTSVVSTPIALRWLRTPEQVEQQSTQRDQLSLGLA